MEYRKLYRSRTNRVIAGVAEGLGEFFEIDPVIIRILFVVLTLGAGGGILLYVLLWIFVPAKDSQTFTTSKPVDVQPEEVKAEVVNNVVSSVTSVFVTEDDVFDITLSFYKENGKMYVSGVDDDFDVSKAKDEFLATFKYPSQGDSELIMNMSRQASNGNASDLTVPDFMKMEVARMMVLIRKWSAGTDLTSEKIYQLHPKIVKGLVAALRQEMGTEGII